MLILSNIAKRFPTETNYLFEDVSFIVNARERVGLIGANGSGKSTLIRIIMGMESPSKGSISLNPPDLRVGYLSQGVVLEDNATIESVIFPQKLIIAQAEAELERLAEQMAAGNESAYDAYDTALNNLLHVSASLEEQAGYRALAELGLEQVNMQAPVSELSGGQKTRLTLARLVAANPRLLVLDEPTNHLDISALAWLEDWIMGFDGGVLVVSHDRAFLDRIVTRVVVLNRETSHAEVFAGNYSEYIAFKQTEQRKQYMLWKDQQAEISRLQADVSRTMAKAVNRENATVNDFQRGRAKMVAKKAQAKAHRLEKYIESDDIVDKPSQHWDVKITFDAITPIHGTSIQLQGVSIGYDRPLIQDIDLTVGGRERIAIIGPNGHGKSTLIKTIIGEVPPLSGRVIVNERAHIGYLSQEQDVLEAAYNAVEVIQQVAPMTQTDARTFLHLFLFRGDDAMRQVQDLSYGERTRLMLARLVASGANVLLMDEPLNHLDITSREEFQQAIMNYNGAIIAILHDRYFIQQFAHKIWHFADGSVREELHTPI